MKKSKGKARTGSGKYSLSLFLACTAKAGNQTRITRITRGLYILNGLW